MDHIIVGCGGIGGWVAQCLSLTAAREDNIVLVDRDKVEIKNLNRQVFDKRDIGKNKAQALARRLQPMCRCPIHGVQEWLQHIDPELLTPKGHEVLLYCGVDNHPARLACLDLVDTKHCKLIIGANGYLESEAYYYTDMWNGTPLDPRQRTDMMSDKTDDPLSPPCTGEIQESQPQLAIANMNAASLMMWMAYV